MKKIKFMLLSLALFAVVGGALAFKARFQLQYCVAPTQPGGNCDVTCPNLTAATTLAAIQFSCYTTPFNGSCSDILDQPLPCITSTKLRND